MMHGREKSDPAVVARKPANKAEPIRCGVGGAKGRGRGESREDERGARLARLCAKPTQLAVRPARLQHGHNHSGQRNGGPCHTRPRQ